MAWALRNRQSGETYMADFAPLERSDISKLRGWTATFNWKMYLQENSEFTAYKLQIHGNDDIQGLVAISIREGYVMLDLAEKSPANRSPVAEFPNAGAVLFAFACKVSKDNGGEGFVSLKAKSTLVDHYINQYRMYLLNVRERTMVIPSDSARKTDSVIL